MAFTARLPAGLDRKLTEAAERHALAKSVLVEKIIREWLQREEIWKEKQR